MAKTGKLKLIVDSDDRFNFRFLIVLSVLLGLTILFGPVSKWIHGRMVNPEVKESCRFSQENYASDDLEEILNSPCTVTKETDYYGTKKAQTVDYDTGIRTEYSYEGGKVNQEYYYDIQSDSINPIAYATLHYYNNNQTTERIIRDLDEKIVAIEILEYDTRGHLLQDVFYEADQTSGLHLSYDVEYAYDNLKIVSGTKYNADEDVLDEITYETDKWGRVLREAHHTDSADTTVTYTYKTGGYDRVAVYRDTDGKISSVEGENLQ